MSLIFSIRPNPEFLLTRTTMAEKENARMETGVENSWKLRGKVVETCG